MKEGRRKKEGNKSKTWRKYVWRMERKKERMKERKLYEGQNEEIKERRKKLNEECKDKIRMEGGGERRKGIKENKKMKFSLIPHDSKCKRQTNIYLTIWIRHIHKHPFCLHISLCEWHGASRRAWHVINRGVNPAHTAKQTNSCIQPPLCNTHTHTHTIWSVLTKTKRKHDSDITPPHTPCPRISAFKNPHSPSLRTDSEKRVQRLRCVLNYSL